MTKATASKAIPVRKSESQGTATTRKSAAPKVTNVADALKVWGDPAEALDTITGLADTLASTTDHVTRWARFASTYTGSARTFSLEVSGDPAKRKNLLGRLRAVHSLMDASRKGPESRALSAVAAVKIANTTPLTRITAMCAEMLAGGDPLGKATREDGTVNAAQVDGATGGKSRKTRTAPVAKVTPDTIAEYLRLAVKVAPQVSKADTAVEIARLATELAEIATARAAALRVRPGRKPSATPATMAS